jgi:hypothetical protein
MKRPVQPPLEIHCGLALHAPAGAAAVAGKWVPCPAGSTSILS